MLKALVLPVLAAGLVFAPLAHAETGDQISAEQAVTAIYKQVQRGCTPSLTSYLQSINWTEFYPRSYGEGRIVDGTPGLGVDRSRSTTMIRATGLPWTLPPVGPMASGASIWSSADV
jgi:hypothetical protein